MVYGSNESLDHADEELDTLSTNHLPLQTIFKERYVFSGIKIWLECEILSNSGKILPLYNGKWSFASFKTKKKL